MYETNLTQCICTVVITLYTLLHKYNHIETHYNIQWLTSFEILFLLNFNLIWLSMFTKQMLWLVGCGLPWHVYGCVWRMVLFIAYESLHTMRCIKAFSLRDALHSWLIYQRNTKSHLPKPQLGYLNIYHEILNIL